MNFNIDDTIFKQFENAHFGVVIVENVDNIKRDGQGSFLLRESESDMRERLDKQELLDLPEMKLWRETYKKMGVKKGNTVSIESLAKRIKKGGQVPSINPLVDIYNAVSLKYVFPCGGEDLDKMMGDIRLTLADGNEMFYQIGSEINEPPNPGEIIYKDDGGCICRCWNWREADRTKLTESTKRAFLIIETLSEDRVDELNAAISKLCIWTENLLGARCQSYILNKKVRSIMIKS